LVRHRLFPRLDRFFLAATFVQWVIERAALLDSRMASASYALGGIVLIAAGVYQWTPLKDVCLAQCQTPLQFLMRHGGFRTDLYGCLLLGLRHGGYCVGHRAPRAACPF
jgi:predicted metal-binding membrane protein